MNAKSYADKFKREMRFSKKDPQTILVGIAEDMVKKANYRIVSNPNRDGKFIADTFEKEAKKWETMCDILKEYPINRFGFRAIIKDMIPKLYLKLVSFGFTPLEEENINE